MKQTKNKLPKSRVIVLTELINDLKCILLEYSKDYPIKDIADPEQEAFLIHTKDFILEYNLESSVFILSYIVGTSAQRAAEITKLIMLVLEYDEFIVIEDCFFDNQTKNFCYGLEAIEKKNEHIMKKQGYYKCPSCEMCYPQDDIADSGFCPVCDEAKDFISWH